MTDDPGEKPAASASPDVAEPADDTGAPATAPDPAAAAPPPPLLPPRPKFGLPWTIIATILLTGIIALGVVVMHGGGLRKGSGDPLRAFDMAIERETKQTRLPRPVAADAERTLDVLLADSKEPLPVKIAARARLAVVLGDSERWKEALAVLEQLHDPAFTRVLACAYGPDDKACVPSLACDQSLLDTLAMNAGSWASRRACAAAARRQGNTGAATKIEAIPAADTPWTRLAVGSFFALMLVGLLGGLGLWIVGRRVPRPPPPALPTPWTLGELYAALVRCAVSPMLWACLVAVVFAVAKRPGEDAVGLSIYGLAWWWVARLVFKRFGLSWRDGFRWLAVGGGATTGVLMLTTLTVIGLDLAGDVAIRTAAAAMDQRSSWSDRMPPTSATLSLQLIGTTLMAVILAPVVEEIVCRRVIFGSLRRRWPLPWAGLASAVIFAIPHGYSPVGSLSLVWMGLLTAWAYERTTSLWPGVLLHATNNSLALLFSLI